MLVCFPAETTVNVRPKKVRKRLKKRGRESPEVNYLENTVAIDSARDKDIDVNKFPLETISQHDMATSSPTDHNLTSTSRGRERSSSRLSTIMHQEDFWVRHFDGTNSIAWKTFRAAFLEDYGCLIQEFAPKRIHWILTIVHKDIFAAADDIHKLYYDKFCGKSNHPDRLWIKIKEYASERIFREGVIESMFE